MWTFLFVYECLNKMVLELACKIGEIANTMAAVCKLFGFPRCEYHTSIPHKVELHGLGILTNLPDKSAYKRFKPSYTELAELILKLWNIFGCFISLFDKNMTVI